jgi:hypothetical protein
MMTLVLYDGSGGGRLAVASSGQMRAREIKRQRSASVMEAKDVGAASSGGTGIRAERWRRRQLDSQGTLAFASGERGEMR